MSGKSQEMLQIGGDEDRVIGGSTPDTDMSLDDLTTSFESETDTIRSQMVTSFSESKKLSKFRRDLNINLTSTLVTNPEVIETFGRLSKDMSDVPPLIQLSECYDAVDSRNGIAATRFELEDPLSQREEYNCFDLSIASASSSRLKTVHLDAVLAEYKSKTDDLLINELGDNKHVGLDTEMAASLNNGVSAELKDNEMPKLLVDNDVQKTNDCFKVSALNSKDLCLTSEPNGVETMDSSAERVPIVKKSESVQVLKGFDATEDNCALDMINVSNNLVDTKISAFQDILERNSSADGRTETKDGLGTIDRLEISKEKKDNILLIDTNSLNKLESSKPYLERKLDTKYEAHMLCVEATIHERRDDVSLDVSRLMDVADSGPKIVTERSKPLEMSSGSSLLKDSADDYLKDDSKNYQLEERSPSKKLQHHEEQEESHKEPTSLNTFASVSKSVSSFASSDELKFSVNSSSEEIMEIPPPDYDTEDIALMKNKSSEEKISNVEEKKKKRRSSFKNLFIRTLRSKKMSKSSISEFGPNFQEGPAATSTLTKHKKEETAFDPTKTPVSKIHSLKHVTSSSSGKDAPLCASWFDRRKARKAKRNSSSDEEHIEQSSTLIICTCGDGKTKRKCSPCSSNYIEIPVNFREISPDDVEKTMALKLTPTTQVPVEQLKSGIVDANKVSKTGSKARQRSSSPQSLLAVIGLPPVTYSVPSLGDIVVAFCKKHPKVFTLSNMSSIKKREDLGPYGVEDMINIDDLNEASILWNLRVRYDKELIYTYIGSILIAMNPYRMSDAYGLETVKKYEGQVLGTIPPHLFAIGSAAYTRLTGPEPENQVVIISGESGAGKTESTKLVMQYLAAVNKSHSNIITEQILEAAPLLESFGNAKTVRNDNSSRFGKYLQVYFKGGVITGAKVTEYLLEKSRIVTQAGEERNYHVFYELLRGLKQEDKEKYGLTSPDKYFYLNQGGNTSMASKDDYEDFQSLLSAMQVLGFTMEEQDTIFRILAAVLHFGNVYFHRKPLKHGQDGVEVGSDAEIKWAGHLLQLSVDGIMRALTTKTTEARNERVFTSLNIDQALDARDGIAKALYSSLFSWLVNRVNTIVSKGSKQLSISILDIFGFEDFKENSFEQLCINYANESLQAHFNRYIFRIEQQEYIKEKIEWQTIGFSDNQPVISLICKKPVGILHLLDDESNFPKASDQSFLEKAHYNHALNEHYCRPRLNSPEFGIKHYAGLVWYSVDGFLDKNRDTLRIDVLDLLISSDISMISKMFQELKRNNEASKSANRSDGRFITMKPRTPTVSARFHDSLTTLLESMSKCNPWFVRCLKPNSDKIPMKFDMLVVLEQLRYTGMLETIRIRKTGYPVRMRYSHFAERFRCLVPVRIPKGAPSKEICRVVLDRDPRNRDNYQLGTSKVFMREPLQQKMEKDRLVLQNAAAIKIQTAVRGHLAKRRYKLMKKSAVKIQSEVRGLIARKRYKRLRRGIVQAQAKLRGTRQRKLYLEMKEQLKKRKEVDKKWAQTTKVEELSMANAKRRNPELSQDISFVLEELDEWYLVHSEKNIVKLVGQPPQVENYFELPPDIHEYSFQKFANMYFKTNALGPTLEPIQTPFLPKSKENDIQDSLALFKLILHFCNNVTNPKREMAISSYIVSKGLSNDKLRDEILCQIVSQSWKNTDEHSNAQAWLLLSCCLSAFAPSPTLYKYLLKYVSDHGLNGYDVICQQKLLQAAKTAAPSGISRSYPPSMLEWRCNKKKVNMAIEAKFPDEISNVSGLESWVTSEEVASLLLNSRGIEENAGWTLSLTTPTSLYDVNGAEFILDTMSELEAPPGLPISKSQFLKSDRREQTNKKNMIIGSIEDKERRISAGSDRPSNKLHDLIQAENFQQQRSLSLGNLMENKDPIIATKVNMFGLSRSKLNERYLSSEKLASAMPKDLNWSRTRKYSNEIPSSSESEAGTDAWSSRQLSMESSKSRSRQGALTTLDSPHINSHDGTGDSDFDMDSSPVAKIKEYKTRHGHPRFVKSQQMFRKSKGEKDYMRSSAHSDTSEAASLASHVRRVRVPSQSSDVDQFLDDLFLPVLDVNIDDLSDARSLATSIKGSKKEQNLGLLDSYLGSVSTVQLDSLCSPDKLTTSLKGGGKGEGRRKRDYDVPPSQSSLRGYATPAPVLLPGMPMPIFTPTGYPFSPSVIPGMMSPTPGGFEMQNITAMQQNMQRLFLQSAVAQNMQIQQQLIAQNQALQQLLQQSAATLTGTPEPGFPLQEQWSPERRLADVPRDRKSKEQVPPPVLPKSKNSSNRDSSVESIDRIIPRIEEKKERYEKSSSERSNVISVSAIKSSLESKQNSVVKKEALEKGPLVASSRRTSEVENIQPAKSGVPPPPPLPMEPLFSGDQPFLDQFGRAKTVRIGKWRWPPEKDDGDESAANFLEFKLQKQAQKKLASQRSIEEEDGKDFDIHFDSFEFKEEDMKKSNINAEEDEARPELKYSTPGSIGKLKLSGELRSKLEMVHSKKKSKQTQMGEEGRSKEDNSQASVTKLSEHRKLLLEKQLYGGRWQSVEEIENITRITNENDDETDRVRRVSAHQMLDQRTRSSSSPPSSYYSPSSTPNLEARKISESHMSRKFSSQSQLVDKSDFIDRDIDICRDKEAVKKRFENGEDTVDVQRTKLHSPLQASFFTYNNVPWSMHVRKEVFSPTEALISPLAIHLVFSQIVRDTNDPACLRLLKSDRMKMKQVLESYGVNLENVNDPNINTSVKKNVVDLAKEFPLYFSRLYPVSGGRQSSDVQLLGVSHSGLRLVKRESTPVDRLALLETIRFDDVIETSVPRASCLQIRLKSGVKLSLYSHRATLIRDLIERFAVEADTNSQTFVRALSDYKTKESGALSFRKGDLIRVANPADSYLEKGYLYGMLNGKAGVFPMEYAEFVDVESVYAYEMEKEVSNWRGGDSPTAESPHDSSSSPVSPDDGKHSLLQFALQHFRQSPSDRVGSGDELDKKKKSKKHKEPGADWTWKEQVDMVKFSKVPIAASLLRLDSTELNKLAIECFLAIMKYMGDLPMGKQQSEVDCVYTLLMNCHKHSPLRDEVYCQLMKQTTSNRSARQDSCQRGWRLLCIVAAYFDCSHTLQPYLLKYLESAAYDKRRAYHGTALVCLQNLRKTIRYGGRKNVPSIEEITALTAGRNAKRQIYQLPGGTERIINTKSTTVVQDIIEEICLELNVNSQEEMEEFSLYCIVEGDTFTMPLAREEYILDVTTELHKNEQIFYLIFCRSVWYHSLRLDSPLYVEVAFNQIAPDYLEGLLLVMPGEALSQDTVYDISKIAALLHRAPGLEHMPNMKETKFLLPKPALAVRDIKPPQWVSLVQSSWKEVDTVKPTQAKAQVLEILQKWPLFGSSFFAVKRVAEPGERAEHILALNKRGVHFLDVITHETLIHYPFSEVISTRKVKSEDGALFLDMKCGNLMQQRITRIQTDQAHEISRLIRQYINIEQRQQTEKSKK